MRKEPKCTLGRTGTYRPTQQLQPKIYHWKALESARDPPRVLGPYSFMTVTHLGDTVSHTNPIFRK